MGYLIKGGPVMFLLVAISVAAIAIIINRLRFYRSCRIDGPALISGVLKYIRAGSPESAIALCEEKPGPLAAVIKSGLSSYREGADVMEEAFQSQELKETPLLEEHLSTLSTIASVSTLLGFTGTVTGMIAAFNNIAKAGESSAAIVAGGISQALLTTAAGLLIAVPTVIFVRYFENRVDGFVNEIDFATHELVRASKTKSPSGGAQ